MEECKIELLSQKDLKYHLKNMMLLDASSFLGESWGEHEFNYPLPQKFEKSILLFKEDVLIGYCINSMKEDFVHIHRIVVSKSYTNQGFGKFLLDFIKNNLKSDKISLKVNVNNIFAINFYFKNGFKIIAVNNDYFTMIYI